MTHGPSRPESPEALAQREAAFVRLQRQRVWAGLVCHALSLLCFGGSVFSASMHDWGGVTQSLQNAVLFVLVWLILRLQSRLAILEHDGLRLSLGVRLELQGEPSLSPSEPERRH